MKRVVFLLVLLISLSTVITSCRDEKKADNKVEKAIDKAGDNIKDAADDVGDAVKDAADDVGDALDRK
ncbi:MAG: hypothetical protein ABI295_09225 [Xanthomarina sp.]